jgi:ABC-2 type transport system permease protein
VFIALAQAGRLVDYVANRAAQVSSAEIAELRRDLQRLGRERRSGAMTRAEYEEAAADVRRRLAPLTAAASDERQRLLRETIVPAHRWLPPGWLPYGAMALAEARVVPAILGTLGLALLGMASLGRACRTTLRLHLGAPGGAIAVTAPARTRRLPESTRTRPPARLLEWRLPYVSEHASAITMAGFRTLTRAPEARLMLLSPLILAVVFGGMMMRGGGPVTFASDPSVLLRPILSVGLFLLILMGMNQIAANQFGFDRDGFRVFVLGSAARRDVLLGKNLALLPLALGLGLLTLLALQLFVPMRMDHFAATLAQTVSVYLVYCLITNLLSIYAPIPIKPGTLRPARTNTILTLVNVAAILVFPFALLPTLVPLGVEAALDWWAGVRGLPIYLGLSVVQVALVVLAYRRALDWQGSLLQAREQQILDAVTVTAE